MTPEQGSSLFVRWTVLESVKWIGLIVARRRARMTNRIMKGGVDLRVVGGVRQKLRGGGGGGEGGGGGGGGGDSGGFKRMRMGRRKANKG